MNRAENPLKQIRTFQGDVAEALQRKQESLVSIQQAEHLKKSTAQSAGVTPLKTSETRRELFFLFLGSLALVVLGTVGAWYAYDQFVRGSATPITTLPINRFVSANTEINLTLTATSRESLLNTLSGAVEGVPSGELRHINFPLSTSGFLEMLEARAPSSLVRAFDPLFMFGALGESTFFIIKLVSFENAFAGMLAWEKNLSQDIGPLFATASFLNEVPPASTFTDITDKNKDIRALVSRGQPILLYSFFNNNMLIITDNIETLRTLLDRLTQKELSR